MSTAYFCHFQDLVDGYVGPFPSIAACDVHAAYCAARGDGSAYLGTVTEVPAGEMVMTEEEDKGFTCPGDYDHG